MLTLMAFALDDCVSPGPNAMGDPLGVLCAGVLALYKQVCPHNVLNPKADAIVLKSLKHRRYRNLLGRAFFKLCEPKAVVLTDWKS